MDDLTTLKGIGKATAKRLVDAGISSFAALATASPDQFQAIDKLGGSPTEWANWVAEAKKQVRPAPVDLEKATPDQVKNQAALIDSARAKLTEAGTAAATAQASGDAGAIEAARLAVEAAQAELDGLIGPGTPSQNSPHTTASEAEDGEAGETAAGLPGASGEGEDDELGDEAADRAIVALGARVRLLLDEDGVEGALAFITGERLRLQNVIGNLQRFDAELARQERECVRTVSVWPVDTIRYDGAEQPVGLELKVDPKTAAALLASGAALDHDPVTDAEEA